MLFPAQSLVFPVSAAEMPPPPPQQYGSQYDYVASPTFQVPRSAVPTPVQIDGDSNTVRTGGLPQRVWRWVLRVTPVLLLTGNL